MPGGSARCAGGGVRQGLCRPQLTIQLGQRGAHRFKRVGVVRGRRTTFLLEARPLPEYASPLHISFTNQLLQAVLGVEDPSDVDGQHDERLIEAIEEQLTLLYMTDQNI